MEDKKKLIDDIMESAEGDAKAEKICAEANRFYAESNYGQAIELWKQAAEMGNAQALYMLGYCYNYDLGLDKEYDKQERGVIACGYFIKAAELGHADAQCFVALCYNYGIGVEKDIDKMLYWLNKSVEQNCAMAMNNFAYFYENGISVNNGEVNYEESFNWYKRSAALGNANGQLGVGKCYYYGRGTDVDKEEAVRWLDRKSVV